ncbi:MAG: hypothetical protein ACXVH1_31035 [Solirubrobacteraceae bacterium]
MLLGSSDHPGRSAAFLVLLGFVVSFLFIRTSARMIRAEVSWWPGDVETASGLHIHHLVWGIGLMTVGGFLGFALEPGGPWYQLAGLGFGVGLGLTADEFALWVRLEDVYWSEEGRASLDAVILASAFMALVVMGLKPFGLSRPLPIAVTALVVVQALVLSVISFLKGRIALGVMAVFVPGFGLWATCRLAKPNSPWARRFYDAEKTRRAEARFPPDRPGARFRAHFFDVIGGRISQTARRT